jgi:taurine transport system permease protein
MKKNQSSTINFIYNSLSVLSIVVLFCLWLYASSKSPDFVSTPSMVFARFVDLIKNPISNISLVGHIWASLMRVLIAFVAAIILGISLGISMGWSKKIHAFIGPVFEILRPIPPIAWIPMVILWFGVDEFPKILLVFIGSFVPIVLNTFTGVKLVEPIYLNVGKVFKANNIQMMTQIVLPASMPAIVAGLKASISSGWMIVVAAEMIASRSGVGFLITRGMEGFDIPLIICSMIIIGVLGMIMSFALSLVERWLCPWKTTL